MFQKNDHNWIQRTLAAPQSLSSSIHDEQALRSIVDSTVVSVIGSGKADDKRIEKAVVESFRSLSRPRELPSFCRSLTETLKQPGIFAPCVQEHLRRCAQVGLDSTARQGAQLPNEIWSVTELADEGLFLDYAVSVNVRRSLRAVGDALRPIIAKEHSLSPEALVAGKQADERAEKFMLAAILAIRRPIYAMVFDGLDEPAAMVQGPSVFAARMITVSVWAELFGHYPRPAIERIMKRCNNLLADFRCGDNYISKQNNWISEHLHEAKRGRVVTQSILEWISESDALRSTVAALQALPISEKEDESLLAVLHAPPPFVFLFSTPVHGSSALYAHTSVADSHARIEVSDDPLFEAVGPTTDSPPMVWHIDADGVLRFSITSGFLPVCESDMGLDQERFDALSARLRKVSARQLEQMCELWNEVPRLYTEKPSDPSCVVHVFRDEEFVICRVENGDVSRISEILEAHQSSMPVKSQDLEAEEAPENSTVSASQSAQEEVRLIHEIHRQVGRPTFKDFFRTLRELGVTIVPGGEGSHQKLIKDGYHSTVSKNVRDDTLLLAPWMVRSILNDLRLPIADYAAALTRGSSY